MSRATVFSLVLFLCVGCQLSPFKESEPPSAPPISVQPAPVEKVIEVRRPVLDFATEARIDEVLRLNDDQFSEIQVSAKNGIVTLTGSAPEEWYKARLLKVVQGLSGVRRVVDQVVIKPVTAVAAVQPETTAAEESTFPWTALKVAAAIAVISTIIWAARRRRLTVHNDLAHS